MAVLLLETALVNFPMATTVYLLLLLYMAVAISLILQKNLRVFFLDSSLDNCLKANCQISTMISMTDLVPLKNLVIMYYFLVIYYILMAGNLKKKEIAIPCTLYISSAIASALQKGQKKFSLELCTWERQM